MPVVNGKIYVIGGWNGYSAQSRVAVYDPSTNSWSTETPMPTARYSLGFAVVANRIYAIGGNWGGAGGHWQDVNEVFVVEDLLFSSARNVGAAITRMQAEGVVFLTYKTLFYELIEAVEGGRHAEKMLQAFGPFPGDLPDAAT